MSNYFIKYQEDIINACKNLYGNLHFNGVLEDLNKNLSPLLIEILNSYYFENNYNANIYKKNDFYNIEFNDLNFKPFLMEYYDSIITNQIYKKINFNLEEIKKELLNIDPFYKVLLEKDELKRNLNLINKNDISYSVVEVGEDVYSIINNYHKAYQYKPSFFDSDSYLDISNKKINFDCEINDIQEIEFFTNFYNKNRKFIIAHNNYQIVGLLSLTKYGMYFNENEKDHFMKNKFIFNSYVSVSNYFKNKGIATELMCMSMEIAKKNNLIYVRSKSTNQGSMFIEKKIDKLMLEKNITHVNSENLEYLGHISNIVKSIKTEDDYLKFIPKFRDLFNELNNLNFNLKAYLDNENSFEKRVEFREKNYNIIKDKLEKFKEFFLINPRKDIKKIKIKN